MKNLKEFLLLIKALFNSLKEFLLLLKALCDSIISCIKLSCCIVGLFYLSKFSNNLYTFKNKVVETFNSKTKIFRLFALLLSLYSNKQIAFAFENPNLWSNKKEIVVRLSTKLISNREKFVNKCYKDGHGWSIGYGDFYYCNDAVKVIKWKYPHLKNANDEYVRSLVRIDKKTAQWRLKKFVITVYENLEKQHINNNFVVDILDEKELIALIDNIYTRGETNFYKDLLWQSTIKDYVITGKMNCIKTAHVFLKQSKKNNGVLARRLVELLDFTHGHCSYDIKFLIKMLIQYRSVKK